MDMIELAQAGAACHAQAYASCAEREMAHCLSPERVGHRLVGVIPDANDLGKPGLWLAKSLVWRPLH